MTAEPVADRIAGTTPPPTVLGKAVSVLDAFTADDVYLPLAEICRRTNLAKATGHRVAADLVAAGMLVKLASGYRLSTRLFALGMRAAREIGLIEVATPFLEDLYERTHETVHLGVRDGLDVVYIAKIGGHRQAMSPSRIGGRMPLHCTAIGKTLLAYAGPEVVDAVVARGLRRRAPRTIANAQVLRGQLAVAADARVAYEHEESAVGIVCVAAPITDETGDVVAAVSITGPAARFVPERQAESARGAAAGISAALCRRAAGRVAATFR